MLRLLSIFVLVVLIFGITACDILPGAGECALNDGVFPKPEPDYNTKRARNFNVFADQVGAISDLRRQEIDGLLDDATILDIQGFFENGALNSEELVLYYVERMQRYDENGLNSVIEINPLALEIARALDAERADGQVRGDMHGIPVLLKDNIATGDGMHAAAGSAVLADWQPDRDAFLVQQLRDNGAIILGKANLSEWANHMDSCMPNGFSALGGQTQNPYGPFDPLGSSSGSAVAAAANLSTVTVASETQGSLILPASNNSVVGLKTSKGLVSGDYIIPLLPFQDVAGPIGRNVTDVAVLLTAMTGVDEADPTTQNAASLAGTDFTQFLTPEAAKGLKVGVVIVPDADIAAIRDNEQIDEAQKKEILDLWTGQNEVALASADVFEAAGMEVVGVVRGEVPVQPNVKPALIHGYKLAINEFLSAMDGQVGVSSLEEIVAFNREDLANRAPYGQDYLEASLASDLGDEEYAALRENNIQSAQEGLRVLFEEHDIDLLAGSRTQAYAPAGFPALTVPAGYDANGQPRSMIFIADYLGEPALIAAGYNYEQEIQARVDPDLEATMALIEAMTP